MYGFHLNASYKYYLRHPIEFLSQIGMCLKFTYQRVVRGWDDSVIWSIDYHIAEMLPLWVRALKERSRGIPLDFFDDPNATEQTDEEEATAQKRYHKMLEEIAEGFEAAAKLQAGPGPAYDELYEEWHKRYPNIDWIDFSVVDTNTSTGPIKSSIRPDYEDLKEELRVREREEEWRKEQLKKFHRGMYLFHRYFFNLWY